LCLFVFFVANAGAAEPTYWQDVRPVLRKYCTVCHSARNLKEVEVSGGLALDSYEAVVKSDRKSLLKAGHSSGSLLVQLVVSKDDEKRMPLGARPLPEEAIAVLRRWIDGGAREGQRPENTAAVAAGRGLRRTGKLDVVLPTRAAGGKLELALSVGPLAPVAAVTFSPDGKLLATGSYGHVTLWNLETVRPEKVLTNVLGAVNDLRFSPDGRLLAVAGGQPSAKGDLRLYQVADWKLLATLGGHEDVVSSVAFHPDSKRLASGSFDKTVRIWDLTSHRVARTLTGHSDFVYAVGFSPDGRWLASCSKDRTVKVVEADTGKSRFTLSGMDQDVLAVAFSSDGKSLVSSGFESGLYWWDAQSGQRVRVQGGHGVAVQEVCFSKDGKLLASAGADRTVRLWNGAGGAPLRTLAAGSVAYAVALSPDGKRVAGGCFDGLVRLWDTASGRPLLTLLALPPRGEEGDWLAVTPEGYAAASPGLAALGRWRVAGQAVAGGAAWKALGQPESVVKAARGEVLQPASLGK
jgi:WD40 repeat protein